MAKSVTKIPATVSRFTAVPIDSREKRKVAGYARVSADYEEQLTSYETQLDYYTRLIRSHDDWEFVSMYSDEGVTGTFTKHRDGFKRMIEDALAGRITKSVSRFARNAVDSLSTIRKLKESVAPHSGGYCFSVNHPQVEGIRHRGVLREREYLDIRF